MFLVRKNENVPDKGNTPDHAASASNFLFLFQMYLFPSFKQKNPKQTIKQTPNKNKHPLQNQTKPRENTAPSNEQKTNKGRSLSSIWTETKFKKKQKPTISVSQPQALHIS